MNGAKVLAGVAFTAAAVALPSGVSASVSHEARTTVPVTIVGHNRHVIYKVRPRVLEELQPNGYVDATHWSAWSRSSARGMGVQRDIGQTGGGAPCWLVLSRVRSGHFTRLRVTDNTLNNRSQYFRWSSSAKLWKRK